MFKLPRMFTSAVLALSLLTSSAMALAGPTYHVTLDTSAYSGSNGNIDFLLLAANGATGASAVVSNYVGQLGASADAFGAVAGALPGPLTLTNADGTNEFYQSVIFSKMISFDVAFFGDFLNTVGADASSFTIALLNQAGDAYLGTGPGINQVEFSLTPMSSGLAGSVMFTATDAGANVAVVPEPSALLLMVAAIGLMGLMLRRRAQG
ncbi:NF038129 family PEP-CTERM protein [Massilia sp. PWRC2]|uniref:NF038129 family PEP-CTERM protein n=1 Tax=Massilia sp. PWRC2 TaxID=2804626 RepID=UPI003CF6A929